MCWQRGGCETIETRKKSGTAHQEPHQRHFKPREPGAIQSINPRLLRAARTPTTKPTAEEEHPSTHNAPIVCQEAGASRGNQHPNQPGSRGKPPTVGALASRGNQRLRHV
jgi:hypothetical protein